MRESRKLLLATITVSLLGLASCQSDDIIRPNVDQGRNSLTDAHTPATLRMNVQMFRGPAVSLGNGIAQTWVAIEADGAPVSVGVDLSEKALQNLPSSVMQQVLTFHHKAELTPFTHVLLDYNPEGHEPPGVYDLEHFDVHFYMTSQEERLSIGVDDPGFDVLPDEEYIPELYMRIPGGVPAMGAHWVDLLAPEFNGGTFTKTFIWGSYDGEVTFLEPMITTDLLMHGPYDGVPIRQPEAYQRDGYYPTSYEIQRLDHHGGYRIQLGGLTWREDE